MNQFAILCITFFFVATFFYSRSYQTRMHVQYHNDERWQSIEQRASKVGYAYFHALMVGIIAVLTAVLFIPQLNTITLLSKTLYVGFLLVMQGRSVEILAIKYFDQRI